MTWGIFFIIGIIVIIAGTVLGVIIGIKEHGIDLMVITDALLGTLCALLLVLIFGGLLWMVSEFGDKSIF